MNAGQALTAVRGYANAGRLQYSRHARDRMRERGARDADVVHALVNAREARPSGDRWRVSGADLDGDELALVVVIGDGVLVVTLF